jgi:3-hydroxyisobutyrate dehydrogenase-like beta-hydroxyacid dehydrogenase
MSVTIIGLGPMGQAMARAYLAAGHQPTVWNRSPGKTVEGAIHAGSVEEALAANQLVILSLTHYQAMYDILGDRSIKGLTLVNLSSDSPSATREAAQWAASRGADFLVGGVMIPAALVGAEGGYVFYSGPRSVFDRHESLLKVIGRPDFTGEDPGVAQLFYQAQLDIFLTSLAAFLHASALLDAAGASAESLVPYATDQFSSMGMYLPSAVEHLANREHPGDQANVTMMGATADHIVSASKETGIDLVLPEAVKSLYDRAIAAGHGKSSWTSLYEIIVA